MIVVIQFDNFSLAASAHYTSGPVKDPMEEEVPMLPAPKPKVGMTVLKGLKKLL